MADRLDEILRRLAEETEALPKADPPSLPAWNFITYRNKNADRFDQDRRRAHFLKRVRDEVKGEARHALTGDLIDAMDPEKIRNLESPYELRGQDHPVWNSLVWMQSLPSAVYATGQMLANKVDPEANPYPDAPAQFAKSLNTFTGGVASDVGILPANTPSRWRDLQEMRDKMTTKWYELDPTRNDAEVQSQYDTDVLSGDKFLEGAGITGPVGRYGGALLDTFIDPYSSLPKAAALARAGKGMAAMGQLGTDAAMGMGLTAVPDAIDAGKKIRDLLNPAY